MSDDAPWICLAGTRHPRAGTRVFFSTVVGKQEPAALRSQAPGEREWFCATCPCAWGWCGRMAFCAQNVAPILLCQMTPGMAVPVGNPLRSCARPKCCLSPATPLGEGLGRCWRGLRSTVRQATPSLVCICSEKWTVLYKSVRLSPLPPPHTNPSSVPRCPHCSCHSAVTVTVGTAPVRLQS